MKYNKSEIMKTAWTYFKSGHYTTFSNALKTAWHVAKMDIADEAKGLIKPEKLHIGDTIAIEYGDYGHWVTCTVTEVGEKSRYYIRITAIDTNGKEFDFHSDINEKIQIISRAGEAEQAA